MATIRTKPAGAGITHTLANSEVIHYGDVVALKAGFISRAVAGDSAYGVALGDATAKSDNQTTGAVKLNVDIIHRDTELELTSAVSLTAAKVGDLFDLGIDVVTKKTIVGVAGGNAVRLVKFLKSNLGVFVPNEAFVVGAQNP